MASLDRRWFTTALADRRLSQRQLAKLMGVDPASVHRLLTGKRPMRLDEATALARLLDKPVTDVLDHAGVPLQPPGDVPVAGWIDGVGEVHLDLSEPASERVPGFPGAPENTVALRAQTSGSPMQHVDGWVYYVALPAAPEGGVDPEAVGRYCLVQLESGTRLLRWVRRGYQRGTWNLEAHTSPSLANVVLLSASPVLGIRTL
jgi:transcriptional regulator with XRE-family HTH domain